MSEAQLPADTVPDRSPGTEWTWRRRIALASAVVLVIYYLVAYWVLPLDWLRYERWHPALANAPQITHTKDGIPGDALNIALIATETELQTAMLAAHWDPADPVTLRSSLRIAADAVLRRPYEDAPVSSLYLWGRKQDLAFEQPVGHDPRQRHHVRFWKSKELDADGRSLWMGAVTFDSHVGLSHTTGQITHHISADIDAERDKLLRDLEATGDVAQVRWIDGFQNLKGKNGGGDPWFTDGRLAVATLAVRP